MKQSTIDALRRLAERPGTEHEGAVARAMLAKFEAKRDSARDDDYETAYVRFARKEISIDEFINAMRKKHTPSNIPTSWECDCGEVLSFGQKCPHWEKHLAIQLEIQARFTKGDRVFYNYWAYPANCPGKVVAYAKIAPERGNHPWAWISVRFDHLKNARKIPIYTTRGWHLSHEPVDSVEASRLASA